MHMPEYIRNPYKLLLVFRCRSNGKQLWVQPPMDCETLLLTQAAILKQYNPNIKVFVYRNLVKALPWYSSVRGLIGNAAYSDWFLKFKPNATYHVPACDTNWSPPRCTNFYHDQVIVSFVVFPPWFQLFLTLSVRLLLFISLHHLRSQDQTPEYPHGDGSCPGPCDCGPGNLV